VARDTLRALAITNARDMMAAGNVLQDLGQAERPSRYLGLALPPSPAIRVGTHLRARVCKVGRKAATSSPTALSMTLGAAAQSELLNSEWRDYSEPVPCLSKFPLSMCVGMCKLEESIRK
jgi:hypothetical protein